MSIVRAEVEKALASFKPSKAIYRLSASYGNSISFSKTSNPTSDNVDDFVTQILRSGGQVQEVFNASTKTHVMSQRNTDNLTQNIHFEMIRFFPDFINRYHDTKNNKLTILFRWYNGAIYQGSFTQHPELERDLWNIFKWLKTEKNHSQSNPTTENAVKLLDVIRQRYEAKGIKL
jgi:hypothetical protein